MTMSPMGTRHLAEGRGERGKKSEQMRVRHTRRLGASEGQWEKREKKNMQREGEGSESASRKRDGGQRKG